MNSFFFQSCWITLRSLCASVLALTFCFAGTLAAAASDGIYAASAQTDSQLLFKPPVGYDTGFHTAVALHPSGLAVEVHESEYTSALWYHIGKQSGMNLVWGDSKQTGVNGYHPAVAITKEGYVIVVHANKNEKSDCNLYYRVGWIDPYGNQNQSITWLTDFIFWDAGFNVSFSINDQGVIVGAHEAGGGGDGLYYRVGHFLNPVGGDFKIQWDSGPWGIRYDTGVNPGIAINSRNEVVQVHQVPGETLLHYRRGIVSGGAIQLGESKRYDNYAQHPAVALLDSGMVLEVHSLGGLISRTGNLSASNPAEIEWHEPVKINESGHVKYPALATNGAHAIETHSDYFKVVYPLYYSVATICDCGIDRLESLGNESSLLDWQN